VQSTRVVAVLLQRLGDVFEVVLGAHR
jgi:hypothetical protein